MIAPVVLSRACLEGLVDGAQGVLVGLEGGEVGLVTGQQGDGGREVGAAAAGAVEDRAEHLDFFDDEEQAVEGHLAGEDAEDDDAPRLAHGLDRLADGVGLAADGLEDDVGPVVVGPGHEVGFGDGLDAEVGGGAVLVLVARADGDAGAAVAGEQGGEQPDRAGADDEHAAIDLQPRHGHRPHADGEGLGE